MTVSPTPVPATLAPTPTAAPIALTDVEFLTGLTTRIRVLITSALPIESYQVWSTWGGGGEITKSFPAPLPTQVDEIVEFTHAMVDPEPNRIHQFGLAVTQTGVADPIIVYAFEPGDRCPGH